MDFTPEEGVPLVLEKGTTFPIQKDAYGVTDAEATWKHVKASVVSGIGRRGFKERLVVKTRKMSSGRYTRMEVRCFAQGKPGGTTSQKTDCKLQVAITWPATAPPSITIAILEHSRGCRMEEVAMVLNNRNLTEEHDSARMRPLPAKRKRQHQIPCRGREAMSEETATVPVCITASHDRGQGAETQKEAENALESFDAEHGTGNQAQGEEPEAVAEARMEATAAAEEVHAEAEAGAGMERDEHTLDVTRNETRVRFEMSISDLDVKTRDVLMGLFEGGHILDGIESFGEDNKNDGFNNGMFSCFVGMRDAPEAGSRRSGGAFWRHGTLRKRFSENAFIACMKALIPFVLDGDAPVLSPMGEMMLFASRKGVTRLGHIGKKSGRGPLNLNPDLTDEWRTGAVSDEQLRGTLNGGTLTIDNTEVDKKTDRTCSATLKNDAVTRMIREETRMGQLCFPRRSRHRGGSLTGTSADGVAWGGSECMLFAKDGGMTNPHVDVQSVPGGTGKIIHMPAAGIIRKVNHADTQGPAKQAIVVHADDMSRVIETLKIDTGKESTSQYSGKLQTLPEFARVLRGAGIRFVVMSFPARCSYALPAKCAHVFITIGLVESSAWHPVFSQKITCSA